MGRGPLRQKDRAARRARLCDSGGGIMHLRAGCMLATQRTASQLLDRRRGEEFDSVRFQVGNARPQLRMVGVVVYVEDARLC